MADNTNIKPVGLSQTPASDPYAEIPSQLPSDIDPAQLPTLDLTDLSEELQKEELYGGRPGEAFAGEALSTATLGLSDVALRAAGVTPERLREVRERAPEATAAGVAAGVVGPALVSGGTSLAAKGASAGFKAANLGGKVAQEAVKDVLKDKVRGEAARKILETAARGAGEGAIVGVGEAISDAVLERKELTGQNIVATAGAGALLGAGFGAAFGTAAATLPLVKPGFTRLGKKLKSDAQRLIDPTDAALDIVAAGRPATQMRLKEQLGDEIVDYFQDRLGARVLTTADDYVQANAKIQRAAGKEIETITNQLDDIITKQPELFAAKRNQIYSRFLERLDEFTEKLGPASLDNPNKRMILNRYRRTLNKLATSEKPFSFKELNKLRKDYGDLARYVGKEPTPSFDANVARQLYPTARNVIDELATEADQLAPGIGTALKNANKDFYFATTLAKPLAISAQKGANILSWSDAVEAGVLGGVAGVPGIAVAAGRKFFKSTVAKNLTILADLRRQQEATQKLIDKSLKGFFQGKLAKAKPLASPQVLVNAGFAINPGTKKAPKTRAEGFKNIQANLNALTTNPDLLTEMLARTTRRVALVSPAVAQETQATLARAVAFLAQKLPKDNSPPSLFQRPYQPAEFELAKFERYLQAVEQPLSVLEDLERGALTREHVEALQAVYPELYLELKTQALQMIANSPDMAYNKKLQISTLLDIPGDSAQDPDTFMELQGNFAPQQQAAPQAGGGGGVPVNVQATQAKSLEQIGVAGRTQSGVQKLATRKG